MNSRVFLLLTLSALTSEGAISVVNKTPRDGTIVKEGRPVRLSCRTNTRDADAKLRFLA